MAVLLARPMCPRPKNLLQFALGTGAKTSSQGCDFAGVLCAPKYVVRISKIFTTKLPSLGF